jgi:hypothetical protein
MFHSVQCLPERKMAHRATETETICDKLLTCFDDSTYEYDIYRSISIFVPSKSGAPHAYVSMHTYDLQNDSNKSCWSRHICRRPCQLPTRAVKCGRCATTVQNAFLTRILPNHNRVQLTRGICFFALELRYVLDCECTHFLLLLGQPTPTMKLSTPLLSLTIWSSTQAFAPSRPANVFTALHVGVAMDWNDQDLDETLLIKRAEACANSDSCSLEEARTALDDVIHVLSGCISGTVLGSVCENVDTAADVVARLRKKISIKTKEAM